MTHCSWQVKCQTAYLYILMSNNEAWYLPTVSCQWSQALTVFVCCLPVTNVKFVQTRTWKDCCLSTVHRNSIWKDFCLNTYYIGNDHTSKSSLRKYPHSWWIWEIWESTVLCVNKNLTVVTHRGNVQVVTCLLFTQNYKLALDDYWLLLAFDISLIVWFSGPVRTWWWWGEGGGTQLLYTTDSSSEISVIPGCVWLQTRLDLPMAGFRPQRDMCFRMGMETKLNGFVKYSHPCDIWIYGWVIPHWSNLAGTSAA